MILQGQAVAVLDLAIALSIDCDCFEVIRVEYASGDDVHISNIDVPVLVRSKWLTDDLVLLLNELRLHRFVLPLRSSR
jgi:hypothetical protein